MQRSHSRHTYPWGKGLGKEVTDRSRRRSDGSKCKYSSALKVMKKIQNRKTRYLKTDFYKVDLFEEL